MADKCKKCKVDISQPKEVLKCSDCTLFFHPQCAGFSSDKKISTRKTWKCEECVTESSSTSSKASELHQSSVLEAIAALRQDINDRLDKTNDRFDNTNANIEKLRQEISSAVKEVGALKLQYGELKSALDTNTSGINTMKEENYRLKVAVGALQREVADLQQQSRKNNIIISGVPVSPRENIRMILNSIARVLDVQFETGRDISAAHRLPTPRGDDKRPPSIVVCFVSRTIKQDWLAASRQRRNLSARDLHDTFPDLPVYLNDHLSPQSREVFNAARKLVREKKLEAVWTSDGRVLAKKTSTGSPFRLRDLQQVQELAASDQREGDKVGKK